MFTLVPFRRGVMCTKDTKTSDICFILSLFNAIELAIDEYCTRVEMYMFGCEKVCDEEEKK